ncbi:CU044_2847 family protein [Amycolatopsis sp. WAC 04182]|uniref:CU044_2847 family protein n=1 Tax=Amycolatopsis sp. WAC 04182 TaxID=2203198 RepID=UPI000F7A021C|nr:CU044_2847 family protein [Amycolatopsis sp. WAC 04182]
MAKSGAREDDQPVEILLEVRPSSVSGDLSPRVAVPEDFRRRASEIADSVAQVADRFRARLEHVLTSDNESPWAVDTIEVGFDIAVQAEAGVVIAKASTGATLSAKLILKSRQSER